MNEATNAIGGPSLLHQYGCGPIRFTDHNDALYERHLLFDNVIDPAAADARDKLEAAARSIRDVLSQRWVAEQEEIFFPCLRGRPRERGKNGSIRRI